MAAAPINWLKSFIRLTRFWNLLIIAIAQYFAAAFLVDPQTIFDWHLAALTLSTTTIAAAGYIINDYYDVKIDLINKPERVVVGRTISRRSAILLHSVFSVGGVLLGVVLGWKIGAVNFLSGFLLWFYSNLLKRLPFIGNLTIGILTGLSVALILLLYPAKAQTIIIIYAMFAFFITLVREIIKDIEDLKGDNTFGCKTLPILWGIRKTKNVIYLLTVIFVASVFAVDALVEPLPMKYFLLFLFAPIAWLVIGLVRADTKRDFYRLSVLCKIIMLLGVFSMALI